MKNKIMFLGICLMFLIALPLASSAPQTDDFIDTIGTFLEDYGNWTTSIVGNDRIIADPDDAGNTVGEIARIPLTTAVLAYLEINNPIVDDSRLVYYDFYLLANGGTSTYEARIGLEDTQGDNAIYLQLTRVATTWTLRNVGDSTNILTLTDAAWHNITFKNVNFTGFTFDLNVDGVDYNNSGSGYDFFYTTDVNDLSNCMFYDKTTQTNGVYIDNLCIGTSTECFGGASPSNSNLTITIVDEWNNSLVVNNVSATINGLTFTNVTGNIIYTNISVNASQSYDIALSGSNYFDKTYSSESMISKTLTLFQSVIDFTTLELVSGDTLTGVNYTIDGQQNTTFHLSAGSYMVLVEKSGYYNLNHTLNVSALDNRTETVTGLYSSVFNLTAINIFSGANLSNLSGWVYNIDEDYNITFNTTGNNSFVPVIYGDYYIYLEAYGYAVNGTSNYKNFTVDETTESVQFVLYSENSILINIYREENGLPIYDNITIVVSGISGDNTYYTVTSSKFIENLTDGNFTLKLSGGNYTLRSLDVTVADASFQTINVYLSSETQETIFTIIDSLTASAIEGASVSVARIINSTWIIITSKNSDITGKVQVNYVPNIRYRISVTNTGYTDKVFYLDPILYPTYTVKLVKAVTIDESPSYQGVDIFYNPTSFYANQSNNLTFTFSSPDGIFTSYNLSVSYPNSSFFDSGVLATGEIFFHSFNVTDVTFTSSVNITYCYDTTISTFKCFSVKYGLIGYSETGSFLDNKDNTYGMGLWQRISLATLIVIIVAGLVTVIGGVLLGGFIGLFVMGYIVAIGFIPIWAVLPSMAVGFFLLMGRST